MAHAPVPIEIGIILRPKMMLGVVHGLTDLFRITDDLCRARLGSEAPVLRLTHYADSGAGGIVRTFDTLSEDDLSMGRDELKFIIIPPCETEDQNIQFDRKWADWLLARYAESVVLGAICGGTFLLAHTGLLDGRRSTTHPHCAPGLAKMFPAIDVDIDALVIEEADLITVGGVMAWTDLGLVIVRRLLGSVAMMETARFMMIDPPHREQKFYKTFLPAMNHGDAAILKAQEQLHAGGPSGVTVADMAGWSGLESRTFARRFLAGTGFRPNEYHQRLRIDMARERLETTTDPIAKVAWDIGYEDPASFRLLFSKLTGLSPSDYRKRFGHSGSAAVHADSR